MPRFIDADALIKKIFPLGMVGDGMYVINAKAVKFAIDNTPTADVVPKSEVERLEDINERDVENIHLAKAEVVREIFAELDEFIVTRVCYVYGQVYDISDKYIELKKKYMREGE